MSTKTKLLFVIPSLSAGGAEKSLVNLLNVMDFTNYEVDLFLFSEEGLFLPQIPEEVNVLKSGGDFSIFKKSLPKSLISFLLAGKWRLAKARFDFFQTNRKEQNKVNAEQKSWKYFSQFFKVFPKHYDTAVAYLEKSSIYFVVEKVKATNKIGWIHTDYETSGMQPEFDQYFFKKLNCLVTISKQCKNSLEKNFPTVKTEVIENISSAKLIEQLSNEKQVANHSKFNLLTVARLSQEKGIDIAIKTAHFFKIKHIDFIWDVIGEGSERKDLEEKIHELGLSENFKLLGLKENPYPYLKYCDIYVQPSRYEGKSIAIDEALILKKPIVVTNFPTAKDQINNDENGLIAEMNAESLFEHILRLKEDSELRNTILQHLEITDYSNEKEIEKFYKIIHG